MASFDFNFVAERLNLTYRPAHSTASGAAVHASVQIRAGSESGEARLTLWIEDAHRLAEDLSDVLAEHAEAQRQGRGATRERGEP
ncbi:hypothetical protein ACFVMC_26685 [Nocardia sp. NPDC127579]|uniref:hypothetical protein n=1 Tax=Nocardia sp. NPDC127579 TaxID=3345402 RepID=UPI003629A067